MLLILEIILTVRAWKAGWKALALLPVGCAFATGCAIGVCAPHVLKTAPFAVLVVDAIAMAALGGMLLRPRHVPSTDPVQLTTAA